MQSPPHPISILIQYQYPASEGSAWRAGRARAAGSLGRQDGGGMQQADFLRKNGGISYCFFRPVCCRFRRRCLTEGSLAAVAANRPEKTVRNSPFLMWKSACCIPPPSCRPKLPAALARPARQALPSDASALQHMPFYKNRSKKRIFTPP